MWKLWYNVLAFNQQNQKGLKLMSIKIEKTDNKNELKLEFKIEAAKFDEAIMKVYSKSA